MAPINTDFITSLGITSMETALVQDPEVLLEIQHNIVRALTLADCHGLAEVAISLDLARIGLGTALAQAGIADQLIIVPAPDMLSQHQFNT